MIIDVNVICPNLVMTFMITVLSMESKDMEEREKRWIIFSSAMIIFKEMLHIVIGMDLRTIEVKEILVMEEEEVVVAHGMKME